MSNNDQQQLQTMQDIGGLLFRRLTNDLDIHEQIALDNWLNTQDPESRQFFEDCSDWDQLQSALQLMYSFNEREALADIQKKIELEFKSVQPIIDISARRRKSIRMYWAAAAVIVILAGAMGLFVLNKRKADIARLPVEQRYRNDVAPGGDKAILQLADGRKIVLDNASNGELAKEGNTRVMKLDNGQLAYQATKTAGESVSYNMISTPRGGQYQVMLPDGSKVTLNAASSIRFPTTFSGKERRVELTGQAFFEIASNASMPFRVNVTPPATGGSTFTESMEVEVLGTEFDLMAYPDEENEKTTVVSGAVKVSMGNTQKTLASNQQAFLDKKSYSLNLIAHPNIEETIAWKNGLFQFQDASIQSIMRQVARWYDVEVNYIGKVDQQFIGKIPRQVNLSTLLKILESTGWVHFQIDGKRITVFP